jgi:hypothetical protein
MDCVDRREKLRSKTARLCMWSYDPVCYCSIRCLSCVPQCFLGCNQWRRLYRIKAELGFSKRGRTCEPRNSARFVEINKVLVNENSKNLQKIANDGPSEENHRKELVEES